MPDTLLRIIEKLMDSTKGAVCAGSGILLALYAYKVNAFDLYTLFSTNIVYPAVTFIVFIGSGMFFLRDVLPVLSRRLHKVHVAWNSRKVACDVLRYSLTDEQKKVLQLLVDSPNRSNYFIYSGHVKELLNVDIIVSREIELYTERNVINIYGKFLYTLQPWAYKYLKKYPAILSLSEKYTL